MSDTSTDSEILNRAYPLLLKLSGVTDNRTCIIMNACINGEISTIKIWKLLNPDHTIELSCLLFELIASEAHMDILNEIVPNALCNNTIGLLDIASKYPSTFDILFANKMINTESNVLYAIDRAIRDKRPDVIQKLLKYLDKPLTSEQITNILNIDSDSSLLKSTLEHIAKYR